MSQLTSVASSEQVQINEQRNKKRIPSFLFPQFDDLHTNSHILKQSVISNYQHDKFSVMCKAPTFQVIFFEALATFIFLFGISCQYNPQDFQMHSLYGVFLLLAICLAGGLTGANINPSITFSNYLRKQSKYKLRMIPIYIIGQFIGIVIAILAAKYINDVHFISVTPDTQDWITVVRQVLNEMMGTIIMVFFILEITNPNTTFIQNQISGFLTIVVFFYLSIVLCPKTNSVAVNFLITFLINVAASIFQGDHAGWGWLWIYLLGEILGVMIATIFYDKYFEPVIKKLREAKRQTMHLSQVTQDQEDL